MNSKHDIDNLFRVKLQGQEIQGAYSDGAWKGANALLNKHYKALFFKKVAFIGIPLLVGITAISLFLIEENKESRLTTEAVASSSPKSTNIQPFIEETNAEFTKKKTAVKVQSNATTSSTEITEASSAIVSSTALNASVTSIVPSSSYNSGNQLEPIAVAARTSNNLSVNTPAISSIKTSNSTVKAVENKLQESLRNEELQSMPVFSIGGMANNSIAANIPLRSSPTHESLMQKLRKIELGFTAGTLVSNGLKNVNQKRESPSIGVFVGLTAAYHINARLFVSSGVIVHERSKLASKQLEQTSPAGTVYSLAQNLTYVDIPLQIGYNIGARHSVLFGMTFSPLVGYVPSTEVNNVDNSSSETTRGKSFDRDGFANFDVAGALGYRFQLTHKLDLTADLRYGLFDLTDNQYFNTGLVDDRNHQFRVGINYRFINR